MWPTSVKNPSIWAAGIRPQIPQHLNRAVWRESSVNIWHSMFTWMIFSYDRREDLMESYREHKELLDAIKTRDKEKALEWIAMNIQ